MDFNTFKGEIKINSNRSSNIESGNQNLNIQEILKHFENEIVSKAEIKTNINSLIRERKSIISLLLNQQKKITEKKEKLLRYAQTIEIHLNSKSVANYKYLICLFSEESIFQEKLVIIKNNLEALEKRTEQFLASKKNTLLEFNFQIKCLEEEYKQSKSKIAEIKGLLHKAIDRGSTSLSISDNSKSMNQINVDPSILESMKSELKQKDEEVMKKSQQIAELEKELKTKTAFYEEKITFLTDEIKNLNDVNII